MLTQPAWYKFVRIATTFALIVFWGAAAAVCHASTVDIHPGADIPSAVRANPAGTTFVIYPGTYRLTEWITAKDGDTFIGQTTCAPPKTACPAILNGSRLLTSFQTSGSYYYVTGQTQQGQVTIESSKCEPDPPGYLVAYPGCIYPEDLYFDDKPLVHVIALADVGPGTWFFDYPTHTIYFYDNPAGHTVETSVTPSAFSWGPANNVTIQGLTVEKFAVPIQRGAIAGGTTASTTTGVDWRVQDNEILLNHGNGVGINFGWQVLNNFIHDNGDLGIGGGLSTTVPSRVLIQDNELAFNNYAHVSPHFGAGGADITATYGVIFRGNYSHNNEGSGLWMDLANYYALYDNNTVEDNTEQGIFHEISYNATARNNKLLRNGYIHPNWTFWLFGANLLSSTSQNLEAYCNRVEVSAEGGNGINMIGQPHPNPGMASNVSKNNYFHHNTVVFDGNSGITGAARGSKTDICCVNFYSTNRFDYNTYHLPVLTRKAFYWNDAFNTFSGFQAAGQDTHGSADTEYTSSVPTVVITSPADETTVSGTVGITGNAQDSNSISKVEFYVDWALKVAAAPSILLGILAASRLDRTRWRPWPTALKESAPAMLLL
jgi:parallel beta-helix repeat protein